MRSVENIYEEFRKPLREFLISRTRNEAVAEDILHDVFLKIHQKPEMLQDVENIPAWLFQLIKNAMVDNFRRQKPTAELPEISFTQDFQPQDAIDRLTPGIRAMIYDLPEPYREALLLTTYEGLTQADLARRAGISLPGAKSRVQRARGMLQKIMLECCHYEFDRYGNLLDYEPRPKCCAGSESTAPQQIRPPQRA